MDSPIIKGKNIYLRKININDIDDGWLQWINDSESNQHLSTVGNISRDNLIEYLDKSKPPKVFMFAVCLIKNDEYIGNARISSVDLVNKKASYGRMLGVKNIKGKGIGTELLYLMAFFSFYQLKLKKITTGVLKDNIASIKSNKNAGATLRDTSPSLELINGKYEEVLKFEITSKSFNKSNWKSFLCSIN